MLDKFAHVVINVRRSAELPRCNVVNHIPAGSLVVDSLGVDFVVDVLVAVALARERENVTDSPTVLVAHVDAIGVVKGVMIHGDSLVRWFNLSSDNRTLKHCEPARH